MARTPLYSPSPLRRARLAAEAAAEAAAVAATPPAAPSRLTRLSAAVGRRASRHERWLWAAALLLVALSAHWSAWTGRAQAPLTIQQIEAEIREAIAKEPLPSAAAAAYEAILPSVVRVVGEHELPAEPPLAAAGPGKLGKPGDKPEPAPHGDGEGRSVGTGVVIVDKGLILTNLHVVDGARTIKLTFWDGSESEASVVSRQPDNDLAVLQAKTIPDDLQAATLRSTSGLSPGDEVLAVGFPFGIGPSASTGVVSGLKREFRSPEGKRILTNLIQFDAAANPGNSGGPLVTMDGHVIGIVTAIMNPSAQRTFIGIGFAVPIENAASAIGMSPF